MKCTNLFAWRRPKIAAGKARLQPAEITVEAMALVLDLSCENLREETIPRGLVPEVRAFRKLREDARVRAAQTWIKRALEASGAAPRRAGRAHPTRSSGSKALGAARRSP